MTAAMDVLAVEHQHRSALTLARMLVLERHPGEALEITTPDGTVIVVKLVRIISYTKVEIGIEAPPREAASASSRAVALDSSGY